MPLAGVCNLQNVLKFKGCFFFGYKEFLTLALNLFVFTGYMKQSVHIAFIKIDVFIII